MIFGMTILTFVHVLLSLIGIFAGLVVAFGLLTSKQLTGWTGVFIWSTVATSVTGFLFPFHRFLPSHAIGILSLIVLAIAIYALYGLHLAGDWRRVYAITAMIAFYLNVFVLIAQLFDKVPALRALAPTKTEAPFKEAQLAALLLFVVLTILAAIKFRSEPVKAAT
jgi:uncharacterized protein YggT (Ycf19 family)